MADASVFTDIGMLDDHLHEATLRKMHDQKLEYGAAFRAVAQECPALMNLREGLYRQREAGKFGLKVYEWAEGQLKEIDNQIENVTREAMKAHPELDYGGALRVAASEHHDLFRLRESTYQVLHG